MNYLATQPGTFVSQIAFNLIETDVRRSDVNVIAHWAKNVSYVHNPISRYDTTIPALHTSKNNELEN